MICRASATADAATGLDDARSTGRAMSALAAPRLWLAHRFEPLRDRQAEWQARLAMVAQARRFLYVSSYFVEFDGYGVAFLEALAAAARRGCRVVLGLDAFGQRLGNYARPEAERRRLDALLADAAAAGVTIRWYRARTALQRRLGAGHHVKVQLSEAGSLLLASGNITARSFDGWNEFSALLDGPIAARALRDVIELFELDDDAHRADVAELEARPAAAANAPDGTPYRFEYLFHDPNRGSGFLHPVVYAPNPITARLVRAIDAARHSVRLSSFYCKPTRSLAHALCRAARRGVRVEIFHSHRDTLAESRLPWLSAAVEYGPFLSAGIRIHECRRGEHSKIFLVDDRWVAFGSYNAEHAAHERLAEVMVATDDPRVVRHLGSVLEDLAAEPDLVAVRPGAAWLAVPTGLGRLLWRPMRRWL